MSSPTSLSARNSSEALPPIAPDTATWEAEALVKSLYWSCNPPDLERQPSGRDEGIAWTRSALGQALEAASRAGTRSRIRGAVLAWNGMVVVADELLVGPDFVEIADVAARLPAEGLVTPRGRVRTAWAKEVIHLAVKAMMLRILLAELAPNRVVMPKLVLLRAGTIPGPEEGEPRRTLDEFRLLQPPTLRGHGCVVDARDLSTRTGSPAEEAATFVRLDAADAIAVTFAYPVAHREARVDNRPRVSYAGGTASSGWMGH